MKLSSLKIVSFILPLIVRTCIASIIINSLKTEKEHLELAKVLAKMLDSCYKSRVKTIGLSGKSSDSFIASLSSNTSFSVTLIDNTERSVDNGPVSRMSQYKLQLFVITATSSIELEQIIWEIKNSRWWNHMAPFYMLTWPGKDDGCMGAYEFLMMAWRMNLLEAKFLCIDGKKGPLIYTFNPYTSHAPVPWRLETTHTGENNHSWSLLMREYRNDCEDCKNIDFEKDIDLGGYEIRSTLTEAAWSVQVLVNKTGIDSLDGLSGSIWQRIFRKLNATIKVMMHPRTEIPGYFDKNGIFRGALAETTDGISDISLFEATQAYVSNLTTTYPHFSSGMLAMTQYRGHASQLSKIVSVLDIKSRIGLCIVFLITIIFLRYFVAQTVGITILNIIRMICNVSLTNLSNDSASRLYLAGLLFLVVTIQGIYQGQLSAIVTGNKPLKLVNTMSDLAKSHYTIHCHIIYCRYLDDTIFKGRYIRINQFNCTGDVLQNSSVACVSILYRLIDEAATLKLHLSNSFIVKFYTTWLIRPDWPLERRINIILQRLVEAHVFQFTYHHRTMDKFHTIDANYDEHYDQSFKVVTLDQLGFAFAILGIGFGCATICFIVEITMKQRSQITKIIRTFRNFREFVDIRGR